MLKFNSLIWFNESKKNLLSLQVSDCDLVLGIQQKKSTRLVNFHFTKLQTNYILLKQSLKINLSSGKKKKKRILTESNETYTECSRLQINVMCQTILEENVYWLSNEHRKIRKSGSTTSPDTICVVPYTSFCVQCLLLYQDWAKFIMILMSPEPCSVHQYLHATWSTFLIHSTAFLSQCNRITRTHLYL